jgi:predicted small lipoprotein YifL
MKKLIPAFTTLAILSLAACGGSGAPSKTAVTPRKGDVGAKVEKSAGPNLKVKEGEDLGSSKKKGG